MNLETVSLTDANPDPTPSTAGEDMNRQGSISDQINALLGKFPTHEPVHGVRTSKHRGGHTPKLSPKDKARKGRATARLVQARKSQFLDAKVLLEVASD